MYQGRFMQQKMKLLMGEIPVMRKFQVGMRMRGIGISGIITRRKKVRELRQFVQEMTVHMNGKTGYI